MKNLNNVLPAKTIKMLVLSGVFACLLFLSAKTIAQPYARIEQTSFHIYDSYAPYGFTCDTKLALYWEDYCGNPYSVMGGTFPTGGFDIIVHTYNSTSMTPPIYLGDTHYTMTSDNYTIATGQYVGYSYSDMWGQNYEVWYVYYDVINNPNAGSSANANYYAATSYTEFYY